MAKVTVMSTHYVLKRSMYLPKHTTDKTSNRKHMKVLIQMTSFGIQNF
jgi:hypothetical protein